MPGFILHLTSAKMLLNQLPDHPHFPYMIASENDFMTGSLLPDATANKNRTHFRNLLYAFCKGQRQRQNFISRVRSSGAEIAQ